MPRLGLENNAFDRVVTLRQSYELLVEFVARYHARGASSTASLLSDVRVAPDGTSCDPAQVCDFLRVAGELLGDAALLDAATPA